MSAILLLPFYLPLILLSCGMSIVGQILDRQLKPRKVSKELPAETRNKYLEDAQMFARSLAETLNEPDGTVKPVLRGHSKEDQTK